MEKYDKMENLTAGQKGQTCIFFVGLFLKVYLFIFICKVNL